jgi:hypothetical protein
MKQAGCHLIEIIFLNTKTDKMTKRDFLSELKSYFTEHEWKQHDENKIINMLDRYRDSVKTIYLVKKVEIEKKIQSFDMRPSSIVLDEMAKTICEKHNITIEELKVNSPLSAYKKREKRRGEYIEARADFCRSVKMSSPMMRLTTLQRWFGYKCHSSIIHLIKNVK